MLVIQDNDEIQHVVSTATAFSGICCSKAAECTKTLEVKWNKGKRPVSRSWYFPATFPDVNNVKTLQYISDIFTSKHNYVSLFKYLEESS